MVVGALSQHAQQPAGLAGYLGHCGGLPGGRDRPPGVTPLMPSAFGHAQGTRVASQTKWTTATSCSARNLGGMCWCTPVVTGLSFWGRSRPRAPTEDGIPSPPSAKVSRSAAGPWGAHVCQTGGRNRCHSAKVPGGLLGCAGTEVR